MSCCCPQDGWCTHRFFTSALALQWSKNVHSSKPRFTTVVDIDIDPQGNVFVVGRAGLDGPWVAQRWDVNGNRLWSVNLTTTQRLTSVSAQDSGDFIFVGSITSGSDPNVWKLRKLNGQTIWSVLDDSIDGGLNAVYDVLEDGTDGVFTAGGFVFGGYVGHWDSAGSDVGRFGGVSGATAYALTGTAEALYVGGTSWTTNDCGLRAGDVARYNLNEDLVWLWHFGTKSNVRSLALDGENLFVGRFQTVDWDDECHLEKRSASTGEVFWSRSLGAPSAGNVTSLAAYNGELWVTAGYLLKYNYDGVVLNATKNEGTVRGELYEGDYQAVAIVPGTTSVIAGGSYAGCAIETPGTSYSDAECQCTDCQCRCGMIGPFGGWLVDCGCNEVPCSPPGGGVWTGCISDWPTAWTWVPDGDSPFWTYSFNWTCNGTKTVQFRAWVNCDLGSGTNSGTSNGEADSWGMEIRIGGVKVGTVTITGEFCEIGPTQTPGFTFDYLITAEEASTHGLSCCSDDATGCGGFNNDGDCAPTEIDFCNCTGLPTSLVATLGGDYSGSVAMEWDGASSYIGTFSSGGCLVTISLVCQGGMYFQTIISTTPNGTDCDVCEGADPGIAPFSCSPFSLDTGLAWGSPCPVGSVGISIHYSE